ncbi:MAG: hypothetical protein J6Z12_06340 [Paludibacteraceae bacterium]|nr:hypothetical protein [Paludibacteraceae bacterium]
MHIRKYIGQWGIVLLLLGTAGGNALAQEVNQHIRYTQIYEFIDELANNRIVNPTFAAKPYTRAQIGGMLREAARQDSLLTPRQQRELEFYRNEYAVELDTIPTRNLVHYTGRKGNFDLSLVQPAFQFADRHFKMRVTPIIGMDLTYNRHGLQIKRWWGANLEMDIVRHVSVWGSIRDESYNGRFLSGKYYPDNLEKMRGARLARPQFLNNLPGCEYKEASYGGDYSDVRAGIRIYDWWGSIGLVKDNLVWGTSYHCTNLLSGRAPSFPMLTLRLTPCDWFEFRYIHGFLNSNVTDSTSYYVEETYTETESKLHYRPKSKYIAANLFTFKPIRGLELSLGNSIVYAEDHPKAVYFIPFAFYKSLDHLLTKGLGVENQNSQVFFTASSRNIRHLHLYGTVYIDEFSIKRWKKSNPQHNLVSWQVGAAVTDWPLKNVSYGLEYTRTNILCYKHSIEAITWTSNSYNLGHYLGDNSQEFYVHLSYKPVRSLTLRLDYVHADKGNDYGYIRRKVSSIISEPVLKDIIWQRDEVSLKATYELWNNIYAVATIGWNYDRAHAGSPAVDGESAGTPAEYLDRFSARYTQGANITGLVGLSIGF